MVMRKSPRVFQFAAVKLLLIATAGWLAVACDGVRWAGPLDIDQLPGGFYSGSFTSTVIQPSPARPVTGIISEGFDAQFLLANEYYAGFVAVSGMSLTATLTEYSGRQGVFVGFDGTSTVSLDGEVTERDGMFGTYTGDDDEGRFALTYSVAYEEGSSLDRLAGIWSYSQASSGGAVYTITLELDDGGQLFGTDTAGCVFSGQLTIIDARYAAYRAAINVSMCDQVDGDYTGLVFYPDSGFLTIGTDNGEFAFTTQLERL